VLRLLQLFMDICLLRGKPQDLPPSRFLFGLALGASLLASLPALALNLGGPLPALMAGLMDIFLTIVFLRGGLYILEKDARFQQTATAIFGAGAILNVIAMPLEVTIAATAEGASLPPMAGLMYLALLVWSLFILGHILRHALDTRLGIGIGVAVLYYILISLLIQQFLPPAS
jgi:hypothetical protein